MLSLIAGDMILYKEKTKNATRTLLQFINEFGQVTGCKINMFKSFAFLYTNNENSGRETKKEILVNITSKRIRILGKKKTDLRKQKIYSHKSVRC